MTRENTEPDITDLVAYRAARANRERAKDDEIVTDVHFSVTRGGSIVPSPARVAELHVLAVLAWCLDLSTNMLDTYIATH